MTKLNNDKTSAVFHDLKTTRNKTAKACGVKGKDLKDKYVKRADYEFKDYNKCREIIFNNIAPFFEFNTDSNVADRIHKSVLDVIFGVGKGKTTFMGRFLIEKQAKLEKNLFFGSAVFGVHTVSQTADVIGENLIIQRAIEKRIPIIHNASLDHFIDPDVDVLSVISGCQNRTKEQIEEIANCKQKPDKTYPINMMDVFHKIFDTKSVLKELNKIIRDYFKKNEDEGENEELDYLPYNENSLKSFFDKIKKLKSIEDALESLDDNKKTIRDERLDEQRTDLRNKLKSISKHLTEALLNEILYSPSSYKLGNKVEDIKDVKNEIFRDFKKAAIKIKDNVFSNKDLFYVDDNDNLVINKDVLEKTDIENVIWILISILSPSSLAQFTNALIVMTHKKMMMKSCVNFVNVHKKLQGLDLFQMSGGFCILQDMSKITKAFKTKNINTLSSTMPHDHPSMCFPTDKTGPINTFVIDEYATYASSCYDIFSFKFKEDEISINSLLKDIVNCMNSYDTTPENNRNIIKEDWRGFVTKRKRNKNAPYDKNTFFKMFNSVIPIEVTEKSVSLMYHFFKSMFRRNNIIDGVNNNNDFIKEKLSIFIEAVKKGWTHNRSDIHFSFFKNKVLQTCLVKNSKEASNDFLDLTIALENINNTAPYPNNCGNDTNNIMGIIIYGDGNVYKNPPSLILKRHAEEMTSDETVKESIRKDVPVHFHADYFTKNDAAGRNEIGEDERNGDFYYIPLSSLGMFVSLACIESCIIANYVDEKIISNGVLNRLIKEHKEEHHKNNTVYNFVKKYNTDKSYKYVIDALGAAYSEKLVMGMEKDEPLSVVQGHCFPLLLTNFHPIRNTAKEIQVLGVKINLSARLLSSQAYLYALSRLPNTQIALLSATTGYSGCTEGEFINVCRQLNLEGHGDQPLDENDGIFLLNDTEKQAIMKQNIIMENLSMGVNKKKGVTRFPVNFVKNKVVFNESNNGYNIHSLNNFLKNLKYKEEKRTIIKTTNIFNGADELSLYDKDFLDKVDVVSCDNHNNFNKPEFGLLLTDKERKYDESGYLNGLFSTGGDSELEEKLKDITGSYSPYRYNELFNLITEVFKSSSSLSPSIFLTRSGNANAFLIRRIISFCEEKTGISVKREVRDSVINILKDSNPLNTIETVWKNGKRLEAVGKLKSPYDTYQKNKGTEKEAYTEARFVTQRAILCMLDHYIDWIEKSIANHGINKKSRIVSSVQNSIAVPVELLAYKDKATSEAIYKTYGPVLLVNFIASENKFVSTKRDIFREPRLDDKCPDEIINERENSYNIRTDAFMPFLMTAYKSGGEAFNLQMLILKMLKGESVLSSVTYERICLIANPFYSDASSEIDYRKASLFYDYVDEKTRKDIAEKSPEIADKTSRYCGENGKSLSFLRGEEDTSPLLYEAEKEHVIMIYKIIVQALGRGERVLRDIPVEISISDNNNVQSFYDELMSYTYQYLQNEVGFDEDSYKKSENFYGVSLFTKSLLILAAKENEKRIQLIKENRDDVSRSVCEKLNDIDELFYGENSVIKSIIHNARTGDINDAILSSILRGESVFFQGDKPFREAGDANYDEKDATAFLQTVYDALVALIERDDVDKEMKKKIKKKDMYTVKNEKFPRSILSCIEFYLRYTKTLFKEFKTHNGLYRYNENGKYLFSSLGREINGMPYNSISSVEFSSLERRLRNILANLKCYEKERVEHAPQQYFFMRDAIQNSIRYVKGFVDTTAFIGPNHLNSIKGNIGEFIVGGVLNADILKMYGLCLFERQKTIINHNSIWNGECVITSCRDDEDGVVVDKTMTARAYEHADIMVYCPQRHKLFLIDVKMYQNAQVFTRFGTKEDKANKKKSDTKEVLENFLTENRHRFTDREFNPRDDLEVSYFMINACPHENLINENWDNCPNLFSRFVGKLPVNRGEKIVPEKFRIILNPSIGKYLGIT